MPTLAPSPRPRTVSAQQAIGLLRGEIQRIADLAAAVPAHATVPTCPSWTAADLVQHVAAVHHWVHEMVVARSQERIKPVPGGAERPTDWSAVPVWFAASGGRLATTLAEADPDAPMYSWAADSHVRFWIRRMLHETTVHRTDLEATAAAVTAIDPAVAADAIDELLEILPYAGFFRPGVRDLHGDGETIHLHATDTAEPSGPSEWLITLEPDGYRWSHAHVKGAVAVRGPVEDLALFMYGRRSARELDVIGDTALLAHWSAKAAF